MARTSFHIIRETIHAACQEKTTDRGPYATVNLDIGYDKMHINVSPERYIEVATMFQDIAYQLMQLYGKEVS